MSISSYRRARNRCGVVAMTMGGRPHPELRCWKCSLVEGHGGNHISHSGHRTWPDGDALISDEGAVFMPFTERHPGALYDYLCRRFGPAAAAVAVIKSPAWPPHTR